MPSPETCGAQVLAAAAGATPTPDPCPKEKQKKNLRIHIDARTLGFCCRTC